MDEVLKRRLKLICAGFIHNLRGELEEVIKERATENSSTVHDLYARGYYAGKEAVFGRVIALAKEMRNAIDDL